MIWRIRSKLVCIKCVKIINTKTIMSEYFEIRLSKSERDNTRKGPIVEVWTPLIYCSIVFFCEQRAHIQSGFSRRFFRIRNFFCGTQLFGNSKTPINILIWLLAGPAELPLPPSFCSSPQTLCHEINKLRNDYVGPALFRMSCFVARILTKTRVNKSRTNWDHNVVFAFLWFRKDYVEEVSV